MVIRKKILLQKEFHSPGRAVVSCSSAQKQLILEFNERVASGGIKYETVPCLCGAVIFDEIATVDRYGILQKTVMCVKCGLVQSNPRMTSEECIRFYSSDLYRLCYEGEDYLDKYEEKYNPGYGKHILYEIDKIKHVGSGVSVLEIGAGGGWNLIPFLKSGAEVLGIDYSPSLVKFGMEHNIPMRKGSIEDITGRFDIIIINHVLEHFLDPIETLRKISQYLNAGGLIYIAVPNIINFGMGQLQNAHNYYFTSYGLEWCCARSGLKLLSFGKAQKIHIFGVFASSDHGREPHLKCAKTKINFTKVRVKNFVKRFLKR